MAVNYTNLSKSRDVFAILKFYNNQTGGMWSILILVSVAIISYMALKKYSNKYAIAGSTYFTSIIALLFLVMGLIPWYIMLACMAGLCAATIYLFSSANS